MVWFSKKLSKSYVVSYVDHVKEFIALYHDKLQAELLSVAQKHEYEFVLEQIQKVNVDESLDSKSRFDCSTKPFFKQKENNGVD